MRRATVVAAVTLAITAFYPVAANAATSWTIQAVPVPAGAQHGALTAVSCSSADSCMTVGNTQNGSNQHPLAESWNGSTWSITNTATPPGSTGYGLDAVSCTSASSCTAVGASTTSATTTVTLAEHWDGSNWSVQPTPSPAGMIIGVLYSVSCTSADSCIAVGTSQNSQSVTFTLAERWNGSTWTLLTTVNPPAEFGSRLQAVSCTAPSSCMATGYSITSSGDQPLAEQWNGSTWTLRPTPSTGGAQMLSAVSCTSASDCTAVGRAEPSVLEPLAEHWNGSSWAIQKVPPFAGSLGSSWLTGVSCTAATRCTAVGGGFRKQGAVNALSYNLNGHTWSAQPTASPAAAKLLNSVSCTSASTCTAVGNTVMPPPYNGVNLPLAENR